MFGSILLVILMFTAIFPTAFRCGDQMQRTLIPTVKNKFIYRAENISLKCIIDAL